MSEAPVLILGAGINGASVARDLVLNGVPVWIIDRGDIASGATSKSSRLIHGGLRYLEYGDLRLVREALAERERLLRLAPQFVRPLRFYVPVHDRVSGCLAALLRLLGKSPRRPTRRGLWIVRTGLWLYDRFTRASSLPRRSIHRSTEPDVPSVDAETFRWLCGYSDAQMLYPERYTLALLTDCQELAEKTQIDFRVFTYHDVSLSDGVATLTDQLDATEALTVRPAVIINATGAWGDATLNTLAVPATKLLAGNQGSHFVTANPDLRGALSNGSVYCETGDGRFVFILPFDERVLIGTTEVEFDGDPHDATASGAELDYLIGLVNSVFPDVSLARSDVLCHYSGVRPLPSAKAQSASAVSRDHSIHAAQRGATFVLTLVGGKLTTSRLLAEETADMVLRRLGRSRKASTRNRIVPGGESFPSDEASSRHTLDSLVARSGITRDTAKSIWQLCGMRVHDMIASLSDDSSECVADTALPIGFVRWLIQHEWVRTLEDLVERRLLGFAAQHARFRRV